MSKKRPRELVTVPFDDLVLYHSNIGLHRGREYGMRDVFGYHTLADLPFKKLAKKVKEAYEGTDVPRHKGWPAQREALRWLVEKGVEAMYQPPVSKEDIRVELATDRTYYLLGGNHRALALYILGADGVRAAVER